jgi:hypothetical protein
LNVDFCTEHNFWRNWTALVVALTEVVGRSRQWGEPKRSNTSDSEKLRALLLNLCAIKTDLNRENTKASAREAFEINNLPER